MNNKIQFYKFDPNSFVVFGQVRINCYKKSIRNKPYSFLYTEDTKLKDSTIYSLRDNSIPMELGMPIDGVYYILTPINGEVYRTNALSTGQMLDLGAFLKAGATVKEALDFMEL